jgi:amino acid transporter
VEIVMTPQDHNKTLVILHAALGAFFTLGLLASPWIIAQNLRHREQIPVAVLIFGIVLVMALLFWSTAIAMYRRKPVGRKLALISAVAVLPIVWPIGTYSWWFMHSEGAKQMYGLHR